MMKRVALSILFFSIILSISAQNKEEKKLIEETIKARGAQYCEFVLAANVDSIVRIFTPNCNYAPEFSPLLESRDEIFTALKKEFSYGFKYSKFELEAEEYKVYDDLVLEIGVNVREFKDLSTGKLVKQELNYLFIWKKSKKDNYRIRMAMWNSKK